MQLTAGFVNAAKELKAENENLKDQISSLGREAFDG